MKIHVLDVGRTKYGDCIIITNEEKTILIDGGHLSDVNLIQFQLDKIFNKRAGIKVDLLIVTHCHSDHIGCLPELVKLGIIDVVKGLVADEHIGWGETLNDGADGLIPPFRLGLRDALQEEDASSLADDELELFLYDAFTLRNRYEQMLKSIGNDKLVRYKGVEDPLVKELEQEFVEFGLKVIGPDSEHLEICRKALTESNSDFDAIIAKETTNNDSFEDVVGTYRRILKQVEIDNFDLSDKVSSGAVRNNQSIVLSVENDNWKALLTGDMQLVKAQVPGLEKKMNDLLASIKSNGPYQFIKLPHHSASNGLNESLLQEWNKDTQLFGHTGGWNDSGHPNGGVLRILEKYKEKLIFARTDRNGMYIVQNDQDGVGFLLTRGDENDFSTNDRTDAKEITVPVEAKPAVRPVLTPEGIIPTSAETTIDDRFVEVHTKVPHTDTKVTITIEVDTSKKKSSDINDIDTGVRRINGTERFSNLLFVTSWDFLEKSIQNSALPVKKILETFTGSQILDIPNPVSSIYCANEVRKITSKGKIKGVVIIGGYDVIPAEQVDVLDPKLRQRVIDEGMGNRDADDFTIWSDDTYGDDDNDNLPELPVSRIPDGKSLALILASLNAPKYVPTSRFGVRSLARPFANSVFQDIPGGDTGIEISEKFGPNSVTSHSGCGSFYYMLHGADWDCTRFWGETATRAYIEAFTIQNVPLSAPGSVIFTGCCWGALTVNPTASKTSSQTPVQQLLPQESIALAYLQAGALSFVGCTGTHYSPQDEPYNYFGKPMHDLFWIGINNQLTPAEALFQAKIGYAKALPHNLKGSFNFAIELKIMHQFTCLGLGW